MIFIGVLIIGMGMFLPAGTSVASRFLLITVELLILSCQMFARHVRALEFLTHSIATSRTLDILG